MITFLRQSLALPVTLAGFWFNSVGEALSEIAYRIEGLPFKPIIEEVLDDEDLRP